MSIRRDWWRIGRLPSNPAPVRHGECADTKRSRAHRGPTRPGIALTLVGVAWLLGSGIAAAAEFKRGASLVEFFSFPAQVPAGPRSVYADPPFPPVAAAAAGFDFPSLRRMGFDHMRVPVDVGPLLLGDARRRGALMREIRALLAILHRNGLGAIVTLLPPSLNGMSAATFLDGIDGPNFQAYVRAAEAIAAELAVLRSGPLALEPMNEPQQDCRAQSGTDWTEHQEVLIRRIRRVAPELDLFLTGGCWSKIEGIVLLDSELLRDPRNLVSVHFYEPFLFTHQGSDWTMPFMPGVAGLPYPAAAGRLADALAASRDRFRTVELKVDRRQAWHDAEAAIRWYFQENAGADAIRRAMQPLEDWRRRHGIAAARIVFTEFGAMRQESGTREIDHGSRARWLGDVSRTVAEHGWGWTVWVLRDGPFGLYADAQAVRPDGRLLHALGLAAAP
jgi:endoglucanase